MFNPDSLVGKKLDQFRLDQYVARGAMGIIYKAFDSVLMRTVALKLIPKATEEGLSREELAAKEEARKRLIQEAKAAGRLSHPNIVTIHTYGETQDYEYICMEYVAGKTLSQVLKEQKVISIEEAVPIVEQILQALEGANQEQIVHRDIKPSNVMITPDGRAKVMDFGIAKLPSFSMTVTGTVLGTPYYMSPEQISGQKVDIRSDIFSVGAVLYEIVTGERPFEAENTATLAYKIVQVDPIPPKILNIHVPEAVGKIIAKALAKDPILRYQTPAEMLKDLKAIRQKFPSAGTDSGDSTVIAGAADLEGTIQAARPQTQPSPDQTVLAETATRDRRPTKQTIPPASGPAESAGPKESPETGGTKAPSPTPPPRAKTVEPEPATEKPKATPVTPPPPKTGKAGVLVPVKSPEPKKSAAPLVFGVVALLALAAIAGIFFLMGGTDRSAQTPIAPTMAPVATAPAATQPLAPPATQPPAPTAGPPSVQSSLPGQVDTLLTYAKNQMLVNPDAAQKALDQAVSMDPKNFDAIYQLARLYTQKRDYPAAIEQYQKAIEINNQSAEAYFNLGYIFMSRGDYDSAVINFESCRGLNPSFLDEVLANLGICYLRKGSVSQAQHYFRQAVAANPDNSVAKGYLSSSAPVQSPDTTTSPKAAVAAPSTPAIEPSDPSSPQTTASTPAETPASVFPTAEITPPPTPSTSLTPGTESFSPAPVDQAPPSPDSLVLEAKNRMQADPAGAQKLLEEAARTNPNHFGAQYNLARLLTHQKNYATAIRHYQNALRLNNRAAEVYFNLGYIYLSQGAYDLAKMNYESCLALTPSYKDEVLTNLGIVSLKMSKKAEAKSLFQQALEVNPNNRLAKSYLDKMGKPAAKPTRKR